VSSELFVVVAVGGPAAAAVVWLAAARWPLVRRIAAAAAGLAASAAGWWILWLVYRGQPPTWAGLTPTLLGATVAALAGVAALLAAIRADGLPVGRAAATVAGLGAAASAVVLGAYAGSLLPAALAVPVPTLAAAAPALAGGGRPDVRGLGGLALADLLALAGLSALHLSSGSTLLASNRGTGAGVLLLVAAGAVKAGVIPGLGTWRLDAGAAPGAVLAPVLRAQGMALAALGGLALGGGAASAPVTVAATVAVVAGGVAALLAVRTPARAPVAAAGVGAAMSFVALGLGGATGTRAFLVLFPAIILAGAVITLLRPDEPPGPAVAAPWRWIGVLGLAAAVASLTGLPAGGGFPGAWLTTSLAVARGAAEPLWMAVAVAMVAGLGAAALSILPAAVWAGSRPVRALASAPAVVALLYLGAQPVRLGLGWWIRVENELAVPELLPASEPPRLPGIGGLDLTLAVVPALLLVAVVVVVGMGVRDGAPALPRRRRPWRVPGPLRAARGRVAAGGRKAVAVVPAPVRAWTPPLVAALLEVAALVLLVRLIVLGARGGFL
jgi:hypothetical protein